MFQSKTEHQTKNKWCWKVLDRSKKIRCWVIWPDFGKWIGWRNFQPHSTPLKKVITHLKVSQKIVFLYFYFFVLNTRFLTLISFFSCRDQKFNIHQMFSHFHLKLIFILWRCVCCINIVPKGIYYFFFFFKYVYFNINTKTLLNW